MKSNSTLYVFGMGTGGKSMMAEWSSWVGKRVSKTALHKKPTQPKPFKSGLLKNTVKSVVINTNTSKLAFTFVEDDSVVDCYICSLVE